MENNCRINNIKFVYKQHLNNKAIEILNIANEYYKSDNQIVRDALLNEIGRKIGNTKKEDIIKIVKSLSSIEDLKTYMENDKNFLTTISDMMPEAIDFVNKYFSSVNEVIMVYEATNKKIKITRKYGVKRNQVGEMLGITKEQGNQIFSSTKFVDVFVGKYMRKKILDLINVQSRDILGDKSKVVVEVSDGYRTNGVNDSKNTNRYVNIDVNFIIPIETLDTFTLSTVVVFIHKIEKLMNSYIS